MVESPVSTLKVILLGPHQSGKTSFFTQFTMNTFKTEYHPTVGISFQSQNVKIKDKFVKMCLWDFKSDDKDLLPHYISNANVCLLFFDITSKQSFESLPGYLDIIYSHLDRNVFIMIVANKIDLCAKSAEVSSFEAQQFAIENNALFYETSAKTKQNMNELMVVSASTVLGIVPDLQQPQPEPEKFTDRIKKIFQKKKREQRTDEQLMDENTNLKKETEKRKNKIKDLQSVMEKLRGALKVKEDQIQSMNQIILSQSTEIEMLKKQLKENNIEPAVIKTPVEVTNTNTEKKTK
ncbi:rab small GTPase [Tritrichomonas foetus]|uniref:Rab small GTPase n=1 Tax=Tritrichomonas foetus TaxID=1144522 RepID=A0A1J4JHW7_9EUKA|nr:rab small GTPase [Tritrichomonas foetus]|eukprot:OHS97203.1 rab small GTPase [Tritrichomonas foetus]